MPINGTLITTARKAHQSWERPHRRLGRAELARRCGCDVKTIWNAEQGRNVQADTLAKIAAALDLSVDSLVTAEKVA